MRRFPTAPCAGASGGLDRRFGFSVVLALVLASAGCESPAPVEGGGPKADLNDNSGLMLPPGFKPVDLPIEKRKEIFRDAHLVRALAVREANAQLPMDEASLPKGDTAAFDKRVADHKAIIEGILEKSLAELAKQNNISREDLDKIEDEARKLRWTPPQEPKPGDGTVVVKPLEGTKPPVKEEASAKPSPSEESKPPVKEEAK